MKTLTADTKIRIRVTPPRTLTADTKIRLSQIKDLRSWVEDRRYQIGEISQKTGLIKTSNGWEQVPHSIKERKQSEEQPQAVRAASYSNDYEKNKTFLHSRGKKIIQKMTQKVKDSFLHYIQLGSGAINGIQRGEIKNTAPFKKELESIKEMQNFMAKEECTAGANIKVYRTVSINNKSLKSIFPLQKAINEYPPEEREKVLQELIGTIIPQSAFTSTSINPKNKHGWSEEEKSSAQINYEINVPAKAHGLYVAPMAKGQNENEEEFLLQNKQNFIYTEIHYDKKTGDYNIMADVILEDKK